MSFNLSKHTLIYFIGDDTFLLYQSLTRKGVLIESEFFNEFSNKINKADSNINILFKDISTFSLSDCLLDNPNGLYNNFIDQTKELINLKKIINLLIDYSIVVEDGTSYTERLGKKENLFDNYHIGNFHQQIGNHVLRNHDIDSDMWWVSQKFTNNFKETTNTPYKWVQEKFMNQFFTQELLNDKKVLDFGCGIGYYSHFFSKKGAKVTAVDPSEKYISIANKYFSSFEINYKIASFEKESDFDIFQEKFDVIYLSDVFLYYFEPYKKMDLTPETLLIKLNSLLNKDGKIYIMDPHGVFHLQSWFNNESPFLLALEYANRKYRVTPNLEEVSKVVESANLCITKIRELKYEGNDLDKQFYSEFPFWWFFELSQK